VIISASCVNLDFLCIIRCLHSNSPIIIVILLWTSRFVAVELLRPQSSWLQNLGQRVYQDRNDWGSIWL